MVIVASALA